MLETDSDTYVGNPYVGPRCFETADAGRFFGRENEVRELRSLVISRQVVLLYAASGTGKSSLLKAGLIPSLARDYPSLRVLPVARVSTEATRSALLDGLRLAVAKALADGEAEAVLLIIDQFEEVFTHEPHAEGPRRSFLASLGQALRELPQLTLLLGLREDFLAQLDPYLDLFPDRLRSHFRLELLSPEAALAAVARPAEGAGVPFTPEAARALVEDLGRSRSQVMAGEVVEVKGSVVDPVQLQVVCERLWVERAPGAKALDSALVEQHGKVNNALSAFYDDRVRAVAKATGAEERQIRDWFQSELITPQGIRKQAQREAIATARLPNAVVEALEDAHLLRAERRRGVVFYELAHDRLVAPLQESNRRWSQANATFLEGWVRAWEGSGRSKKVLLLGKELIAAEREVKSLGKEAPPVLAAFLDACQREERRRRRWRRRIGWGIAAGLAAALVFGAGFAMLAFMTQVLGPLISAERARAEVSAWSTRQIDYALLAALIADRHEAERKLPDVLTNPHSDFRAPLFAALSASPQLETLLYLAPNDEVTTLAWTTDGAFVEARDGQGVATRWELASGQRLEEGVDGPPLATPTPVPADLVTRLSAWRGLNQAATALALSPSGNWLASAHGDRVAIWQIAPRGALFRLEPAPPRPASASPSQSVLANSNPPELEKLCPGGLTTFLRQPSLSRTVLGCRNGELQVIDSATDPTAQRRRLFRSAAPITHLGFDPTSGLLATGSANGELWLWNLVPPRFVAGPLREHAQGLTALAFEREGRELVTTSSDGLRIRWNLDLDDWRRRVCRIANRNPTADELESHFYVYEKGQGLICPGLPSELQPPTP